ncbi:GNAT family N-acetyltransferase [Paenibacillus violae]|nr:GNAT family N-acetyltransferase [Paenibacillus sp. PFR10]
MQLVEESTLEGFRHLKRLVSDYEAGTNRFDKDGEALFIATQNGDIVGVCGLNQDPIAGNGRVRRLYVLPDARRFGIGRLLMEAVITEAKNYYRMLVLKTDNPAGHLNFEGAANVQAHQFLASLLGAQLLARSFRDTSRFDMIADGLLSALT